MKESVACILNNYLCGNNNNKAGGIMVVNSNNSCKQNGIALAVIRQDSTKDCPLETRLYGKRWLMLAMHFFYTLLVSLQFAEFVIIANVIIKYYNIPSEYVDYTTVCYMVMYLPLIVPALWIFDKIGIRNFMLLTVLGMCLGTWIKVYGSFAPDRYMFIMFGQTLVAGFQVLSFGLAPRISAIWFGPNEVSTACSIAFFGDQLGSVLSFALPGLIVKNSDDLANIGSGIILLNLSVAIATTVLCISIALVFEEAPPLPPSSARMLQNLKVQKCAVRFELKEMLTNFSNILMMAAYGMSVAVLNAFIILLNKLFLDHYPSKEHHLGIIATIIMLIGIVGSLFGGYFLDKTHLFKETAVFYYGLSCVAMAFYSFALRSGQIVLVYLSTASFGFFIMGYYSVGVQMCIEATYPISECISSSVLLFCVHVFGIIFTCVYRIVCERIGHLAGNLMLTAILFVGTVLTAATPVNLSRQRAEETGKNITNGGHQSVTARNGINNCDDNNEKRVNDVDNNNAKSVATFP